MYIHKAVCISAQQTFAGIDLSVLNPDVNGILKAAEPKYENIPLNVLRRMGKAVRLSIGASMPLVNEYENLDGIIIGTANGGMEDCIKFLNQVMEYNEGTLTPTNFVQSTPNAIAAQIGLNTRNNQYNITHVHRGLAFENAMIDAMMFLNDNGNSTLLLGGVDEVSDYNYNIERLGGWYRLGSVTNSMLYETLADGSMAGEGAAMFIVNNTPQNASANILAVKTISSNNANEVVEQLQLFLDEYAKQYSINLFLSGENADQRLQHFYSQCEEVMHKTVPIARFKHYTGEFPTASALAVYLAMQFILQSNVPLHFVKQGAISKQIDCVLIYNTYKGEQHSFTLISKP